MVYNDHIATKNVIKNAVVLNNTVISGATDKKHTNKVSLTIIPNLETIIVCNYCQKKCFSIRNPAGKIIIFEFQWGHFMSHEMSFFHVK